MKSLRVMEVAEDHCRMSSATGSQSSQTRDQKLFQTCNLKTSSMTMNTIQVSSVEHQRMSFHENIFSMKRTLCIQYHLDLFITYKLVSKQVKGFAEKLLWSTWPGMPVPDLSETFQDTHILRQIKFPKKAEYFNIQTRLKTKSQTEQVRGLDN